MGSWPIGYWLAPLALIPLKLTHLWVRKRFLKSRKLDAAGAGGQNLGARPYRAFHGESRRRGYSASFRRTQDKLYPGCNLRPCRTCPRNGNSLSKAKLLHRNGKVMPDGLLGIFTMERAFWKAPKGPTPLRPRLEGRNELEPR